MTPEQIAKLEAAEQAATPGPWTEREVGGGAGQSERRQADARFIVLARNHIADLIAERKRLIEALTNCALAGRFGGEMYDSKQRGAREKLAYIERTAIAALRDEDDAP